MNKQICNIRYFSVVLGSRGGKLQEKKKERVRLGQGHREDVAGT